MSRRSRLVFVALAAFAQAAAAHEDKSPAPSPPDESAAPLQIRAAPSHSTYSASTRLWVKVDYSARAEPNPERPPLNLALVLDSSGSMAQDNKLKYTLDAARAVLENLSERDVVSLITFNDRVTVLSPAGRAVNKSFLFHRLEEIAPRGFTDISAGLLEGIAQIRSQSAEGQLRQVLLLTDGQANRGLVTTPAMQRLAGKTHADGIGISTLGCGTEFNEKNLAGLAEAGGGRYTYIKSPEQIPVAFAEELHGLLEASAQNVQLDLTATGATIVKINGQPVGAAGAEQKIPIGNVRAGERGLFLLELKPASVEAGSVVDLQARLTFDDPQTSARATAEAQARTTASADAAIEPNEEVVLYGQVLDALMMTEDAAKGLDAQGYKASQASTGAILEKAHEYALAHEDQELLNQTFLLKHLTAELAAAQEHGLLHEHEEARAKFTKEADYRRYLLNHHRPSKSHAQAGHD